MNVRVALGIAAALFAVVVFRHPAPRPAFAPADAPSPSHRATTRPAATAVAEVVYVSGAVVHPGLYRLAAGQRVADAVARAGGIVPGADAAGVNLAARAQDGDEIYVPAVGEAPPARRSSDRATRTRAPRGRRIAARLPVEGSIDVNAAGEAELARVPGFGRAVAARIVELRERAGPFANDDELLDVAGMTQARLDRALPFLHPLR